jgi:hypothetical protein
MKRRHRKIEPMGQHSEWLVVAESPSSTRDFGITVIHRDYQLFFSDRPSGIAVGRRIAVAGGDDWRPLTVALLRDVAAQSMAAQIDLLPLSAANVSVMAAGPNSDEGALDDAILHHLSKTL